MQFAQLPGPTHFPGPMELVVVLGSILLFVALPIAAVVAIFLYLRRIDKRLERIEEGLARPRPHHDPSQHDQGR